MISVCMATYNGEKYLCEQVDSILMQLGEQDELIISDDGSLDNTLSVLANYNDSRIRIIKNINRRGVTGNFENAIYAAKGEYIFLADQDDVWLDYKVKLCMQALDKHQAVITNCYVTDENLNIVHESYFKLWHSSKGLFKNIYRSSYLGCCLAFRRDLLKIILPFPSSLLLYHDWWIGFFIDWIGSVKFIDVPCIYFRRHCGNITPTAQRSKLSLSQKIYYRLQLVALVFLRLLHRKNDI